MAAEPPKPVAAVLSVVPRGGRVLLVRRAKPPDRGRWGFPGGRIEPGETLVDAALRELAEETGVMAEGGRVLTALDSIHPDGAGNVAHHFVLVAVLCRWIAGEGAPADDALETGWFTPDEIAALEDGASRDVTGLAERSLAAACDDPIGS